MKKLVFGLLFLFSSAAFAADTLTSSKTQIKTNAKTDVQAQQTGQDGSTLLQVSPNNTAAAGAGAGGAQVLPAIVQAALPTYSVDGKLVGLTVDSSGRTYVTTDAASNLRTNITQVNGSALAATNPVFTQLSDGSATYTGAKSSQLPTSLGQTTMSGSVSVAIASNQSTLPVSQGAPTGATSVMGSTTNIASAGTTAISCSAALTSTNPVKLYRARVTGAAMARCTVRYNSNGSFTNFGNVMTTPANPNGEITFPAGFASATVGATGTQAIELNCTNFDSAAQDFGVDCSYCSASSGC